MTKRFAQYFGLAALLIALGTAGCSTYGGGGSNGGMYPTPRPMPMPSSTMH
jgi:hypothetical protein